MVVFVCLVGCFIFFFKLGITIENEILPRCGLYQVDFFCPE